MNAELLEKLKELGLELSGESKNIEQIDIVVERDRKDVGH